MDLEQLQTQRPAIYKAAVAEGVKRERDRVVAHVELGQKTGDMRTVYASIESGAAMTPEIFAAYMSTGRNRADIAAREADDEAVHAAIENMKQPESAFGDPLQRQVTDRLVELLGHDDAGAAIEDLEVGE